MKIKNRIRKYISISLVAELLLSAVLLSGCGIFTVNVPSQTEEAATTATEPETTPPEELDVFEGDYSGDIDRFLNDLSGKNYNGAVARIVTVRKNLVVPDENSSKVLSEDLHERNDAVEKTLGVSLSCDERDAETLYLELREAVRSGSYYADIVMYPQYKIGSYVTGGAVLNLNSLPGFESAGGYYYQSAVAAATGGDALYAVAGPASLNSDGLSCIYFNKDIITALGIESPYSLADRGEWTIDKYIQYANSAGAIDGEYYGYGAQNTQTYLSDVFYFGSGETLTTSVQGYYPALSLGSERCLSVIEKIKSATVTAESSGNALTAIETFAANKTLFLVDRVDTMKTLAASGVNWGLLPIPKYDAAQEKYLTYANSEDALFISAVPTSPNYELTSDLIACMNIVTYGYTKDAYVTNATYYYLRDNESVRMLDKVVSNPVFDFAYSFASTYNSIPSATFMAVRNTVSGVSTLQRYINMWARQFENSMYYLFDVEE
ncbi:MAG: hypothetical protein IJD22_02050 [Clostridia bacterium]|nr:hypothetical protein [Clostridia bacterium]